MLPSCCSPGCSYSELTPCCCVQASFRQIALFSRAAAPAAASSAPAAVEESAAAAHTSPFSSAPGEADDDDSKRSSIGTLARAITAPARAFQQLGRCVLSLTAAECSVHSDVSQLMTHLEAPLVAAGPCPGTQVACQTYSRTTSWMQTWRLQQAWTSCLQAWRRPQPLRRAHRLG